MMLKSCVSALVMMSVTGATQAATPADLVYIDGSVYTVNSRSSVEHALAVRDGRIVYVGEDAGAKPFIAEHTRVVDLHGRMLMPGLIDGHMHPLEGGTLLRQCYLNYESLTVAQFKARIQKCLDDTRTAAASTWLQVVAWYQAGMLPAGSVVDRAVLDELGAQRPIVVRSSFGHTSLLSSRGLAAAHITAETPDPVAGKIEHNAKGEPTGLLQDAAQELVTQYLPGPTAADDAASATAALKAMARQGITTFLDARATPDSLAAFATVEKSGGLTARGNFAVWIDAAAAANNPTKVVADAAALAHRYDQGPTGVAPKLRVPQFKMFLDGISTAPENTGAMLTPYFVDMGSAGHPDWQPGRYRGPDPMYFPVPLLRRLVIDLYTRGLEPHIHAVADRSVREALNSVETLRQHFPGRDIRAAIAHDDVVDAADFPRYKQLNALPVLSFQWEKPAPEYARSVNTLGPVRYKYLEPAGVLADHGARIAFGSDWPVDRLDEWFAFKVGVTREADRSAGPEYRGRLSADRGLTPAEVVRAATLNAAYELHQDDLTGSLEVGKLADLIVLDRNLFEIAPQDIASVQVEETVVGGKVVYSAQANTTAALPRSNSRAP